MQPDELLPEHPVHDLDGAGVGPVAVVDRREGYAQLLAPLGREHHVGGVQAVDEVGREGRLLLGLIDG